MINRQQTYPEFRGKKKNNILSLILFSTFILGVFSQTTPFIWNWPVTVLEQTIVKEDSATRIQRSEKGSVKRRVGLVVLASTLFLSLIRAKRRFQLNTPLGWVIICYLGWILCSLMWSVVPMHTLKRLAVTYLMWGAAITVVVQLSIKQLACMAVFVTGMTLLIGFGNEIRLGTLDVFYEGWRFSGVFHAMGMGRNCSILVVSSMYLISVEERVLYRNLLWCVVLVAIIGLVLTRTRTTVISSLVCIGIYWSFVVETRRKIVLILGAVICLSGAYVIVGHEVVQYGSDAASLGRGGSSKQQVMNLTGRVPMWKYSFKFLAERPLHGYGYNTFLNPYNVDMFYRDLGWRPSSLHSAYVSVLMGTGFIGCSLFLLMMVCALARSFVLARADPRYYYIFSIIVWVVLVQITGGGVGTGMDFVAFYVTTCFTRVAFLPAEDVPYKQDPG